MKKPNMKASLVIIEVKLLHWKGWLAHAQMKKKSSQCIVWNFFLSYTATSSSVFCGIFFLSHLSVNPLLCSHRVARSRCY